ncbi:hypothetical protein ACK83U_12400 [Rhizobium sp. WW22]|uniref:hypothetical protein n=1 Tax=Rhizobium sp. WW22 TaxID=3389070 RepID=UPI000DD9C624
MGDTRKNIAEQLVSAAEILRLMLSDPKNSWNQPQVMETHTDLLVPQLEEIEKDGFAYLEKGDILLFNSMKEKVAYLVRHPSFNSFPTTQIQIPSEDIKKFPKHETFFSLFNEIHRNM